MMDALKDLKWPPALVVIAAFGAVVGLYALGAELTAISTFITAVGVAYGAYRISGTQRTVERVEHNTNGTLSELQAKVNAKDAQLIALQEQHKRELAQAIAQMPAGALLPKTLTEDPPPVNGS